MTDVTDEAISAEAPRRGRPSSAELEERRRLLDEREAALKQREEEIALAAAEANLALREAEATANEARVAGRSGSIRADGIRSDTISQPVRGRRYKGTDMPNKFHIPQQDIPLGTSYQWNNHTVFGKEQHAYSAYMEMQGWTPVPAERHPHLVPRGYKGPIIVDGQILMERPQELTEEAIREGVDKARGEVRAKEEQLYGTPSGTLPRARANGSNEFIAVNRSVEPGTPTKASYDYATPGVGGIPIE